MRLPGTYKEAIRYLESFVNYEKRLDSVSYTTESFDLQGFAEFMHSLDNPQDAIPSIHIAGTKGKGSTAALLQAALMNCGLKTGLYTSPHLHSYRERFRINRKTISSEEFVHYIDQLMGMKKNTGPNGGFRTVFELLTAMAFLWFRDSKPDFMVIETGLGGRLDATNVISSPLAAMITALGLEHTQLLGPKISDIAREKAGIVKKGVPLILARQKPAIMSAALPVIQRICNERGASLIQAHKHFTVKKRRIVYSSETDGCFQEQEILFLDKQQREIAVRIPMPGLHQAENVETVLTALEILGQIDARIVISRSVPGMAGTCWPGRVEILQGTSPMVVLDGAHCPLSSRALAETLLEVFPSRRFVLVFGLLRGKNVREIFRPLCERLPLRQVIVFEPPSPRALPAGEALCVIKSFFPGAQSAESPHMAAEQARAVTRSEDIIVVAGSIYSLDIMRQIFKQKGKCN